MTPTAFRSRLPRWLDRYLWFFETRISEEVQSFAKSLPVASRVLDAGAGEGQYAAAFSHCRYTGVDLAIGDAQWDYTGLHALCDLTALPFPDGVFDASINIVTLEHVRYPERVIGELGRTLRPGGRLLLVAPQDWEVHQAPHDYFRYTRYGLLHLLETAGFRDIRIEAGGGYFRLMGRRMLNGISLFQGLWKLPAALVLGQAAYSFRSWTGSIRNAISLWGTYAGLSSASRHSGRHDAAGRR